MSHPHTTPEYRLARSDSKNPATTCWGLRADGQKCRRTVASAKSSPSARASKGAIPGTGGIGNASTVVFCWQHKDQEVHVPQVLTESPKHPASSLKARSSIETLVERVGLLAVGDQPRAASAGKVFDTASAHGKPAKSSLGSGLPPDGHGLQRRGTRRHSMDSPGDLMFQVDNASISPAEPKPGLFKYSTKSRRKSNVGGKLVRFIMGMGKDEDIVISRVRHPRTPSDYKSRTSNPSARPPAVHTPPQSTDTIHDGRHYRPSRVSDVHGFSPLAVPQPVTPERRPRASPQYLSPSSGILRQPQPKTSHSSTLSDTEALLSWIPKYLSPITISTLLKELCEPISNAEEPGYIYMCWVTSQAQATSPPPAEIASSLLLSSPSDGIRRRNTGEIMRSVGVSPNKVHVPQQNSATDTITLKIGRAANVHRRMNQWKEQCGHNLTLMRYYPHVASSPSVHPGAPIPPRKVPHAHKVERLVHLELADRRVKLQEPCSRCGRKHKEWFEIKANREQLRTVDACVRRWVEWSEQVKRKMG
ncbi:conserved hypothetical protein [Histoplasma capsulatum var. duboisii H88]|uniref:Bacteriophage T5 Orf172 DNA-binding domain-containing protein n=2 Tax=Ajellomyces capsulatus TaxID=5037 RepID=F0UFC6_AJEC8|nr:conserved hypothetical protein [Histoplasma capsulatum var. duboisii H88]QSS55710.1 hypothetical protein I7I53_03673 [Histoplasma capsulatum var. duboisii H88]